FFFILSRLRPRVPPPLFPYTTLFRSFSLRLSFDKLQKILAVIAIGLGKALVSNVHARQQHLLRTAQRHIGADSRHMLIHDLLRLLRARRDCVGVGIDKHLLELLSHLLGRKNFFLAHLRYFLLIFGIVFRITPALPGFFVIHRPVLTEQRNLVFSTHCLSFL